MAAAPASAPTIDDPAARAAWDDALTAAACIAVDPVGLGGIRVRAAAGPVRDQWIARWRAALSPDVPVRQVPLHADAGRLFGSVDLAASLVAGRPVRQSGLLAQVDGGYALLTMAERIEPSTASRLAAALETHDIDEDTRSSFAALAFDEGDGDECIADTLDQRLALSIDLRHCSLRTAARGTAVAAEAVANARLRLADVAIGDEYVAALCAAADALGIGSMRTPLFALRVARVLAALDGRDDVDADDTTSAARLVFAHRARRLAPPSQEADDAVSGDAESPPEAAPDEPDEPPADASDDATEDLPKDDEAAEAAGTLDEVVLDAAVAAIPAGLLQQLVANAARQRSAAQRGGGAGATGRGGQRGAPAGIRRGRPRPPERLSLVETLRAAAPWQRLRRAEAGAGVVQAGRGAAVHVRADDLHVVRFKQRHPTTTVFVVDASGSSALHRLAEAKGAVELLLADCYVRRDSVAVLAFRGRETTLLLPPTRSLVRARRSLAGLPGGGGTPLASALDATRDLVIALRRRGDTVLAVLLTDGRANVARDGAGGRPQAEADALTSARALSALDVDALLIDTSPQPHPQAVRLAAEMGALYRPLPHAGAFEMSAIVNRVARDRSASRR